MTSGLAAAPRGFIHEAGYYSSADEFRAMVLPFLTAGLQAREPTVAAMRAPSTRLIRAALGDTSGISFLEAHYLRPASAISTYRKLFSSYLADGAQRIRVVGELPHPGSGHQWEWWARYEAVINHAFAEFPLRALCAYDTRITPAEVLADVARTHPRLANGESGPVVNAAYEEPADFVTSRPAVLADPLETGPPTSDLLVPDPSTARSATQRAARDSGLDGAKAADFVYAVNEAVTNALCHGTPPARLRLWSGPDRIVAAVTDRGHGPADPFAGLHPVPDASSGGAGLWLAHQLCDHVTLGGNDDGFTVHLATTLAPTG